MPQAKAKPTRLQDNLTLPVRVSWRGDDGDERVEAARMSDFTPRNATLRLSAPPEIGQLLCLTLTGPRPSAREESEGVKSIWALVWATSTHADMPQADSSREEADEGAPHYVSVVFVGDIPVGPDGEPAAQYGYLAEDDGRFRLQRLSEHVAESGRRVYRRKESRLSVPVELTVEVYGDGGEVVAREQTVTENISRGGAAVWTSLTAGPGRLVRVTCERQGVSAEAVVRARRAGADGITRLHLEFVNFQWPLDKLR